MNQSIERFLAAGRRFRVAQPMGDVLLVESDEGLRRVVEQWVLRTGAHLTSCVSVTEAEAFLAQKPKWVILGLDSQVGWQALAFLQRVDKEYPTALSVVVSCSLDRIAALKVLLPRITAVLKGDGLEEALVESLGGKA